MKNKIVRKKIKYLSIGLVLGLLIACGGVYVATSIDASSVGYSK